eukprot:COSAG01_NODE_12759_length_1690_cov_1.065368_1_plen_83_part_00
MNQHSRSVVFIFHPVGRQPSKSSSPLAVQHVRRAYMTPLECYHDGSHVFILSGLFSDSHTSSLRSIRLLDHAIADRISVLAS